MQTLNLQQSELGNHRYRITVFSDLPGLTLQHAVDIDYRLSPADREALRWYLEDYLDQPFDPNPSIAARTEQRLAEIGRELFEQLFDTRKMIEWWARAKDTLSQLRIEVSTSVAAATAIPWELLRDPVTDTPLALEAAEFVRSHRDARRQPTVPAQADQLRILLVICRPREDQDVPFRSVASHLVRGLNAAARRQVSLTVLRPPTFEQLSRTLHDADHGGAPFHVGHFDGHGLYADAAALKANLGGLDALRFDAGRQGPQGFLLFENPNSETNSDFTSGERIGELLVKTRTPVLVLNACRSAHAEAPERDAADASNPATDTPAAAEPAFGSLAQAVMDAGVTGVVAMRYNLWVVTATHFVYELYRNLVRGKSLGAAVSQGRKQLHAEPRRRIAYQDIPLQDWPVPVVFEAAPIRLLPQARETGGWGLRLGPPPGADGGERQPSQQPGSDQLPPPPDIGFIGRDETLLALDRAFDRDRVVLLHAYAGAGKTTVAAEFARWYRDTGGLGEGAAVGPVLFTSFETHKPLYQVLGDFGEVFAPALEQHGIPWGAIADLGQRRDLALQVLAQVPVLWVWDNLEPVAGFPEGAESAWSTAEQAELLAFLRAARQTQARFLLTSRRPETPWLGDLPRRIQVPPMPMAERAAFAEALAQKQGKRLAVADWRPLLRFTEGNPLTLLVVIRQALAEGLGAAGTDADAIGAFVRRLRAGETGLADAQSEHRDRSLAASLSYGFECAFDADQQRILALLVFFQGFVDVDALQLMGSPDADWSLPALRGQDRNALMALLERAAGLGLLEALGGGYFRIHPALPWFFRRLFERCWPAAAAAPAPPDPADTDAVPAGQPAPAEAATQAFCTAMGELGNYYHDQYGDGRREVIGALRAEEANLLQAWRLARRHGLWHRVIGPMQGLRQLYGHTGRRAEWAALVAAVLPDLVADDGGPRPGREDQWGLATDYRVRLAEEDRDWAGAERLQRRAVDWHRERAEPLLARPAAGLDGDDRNRLRTMAASLHELGEIRRGQEHPDCVAAYEEALALLERIGETAQAAICAFNLGHVHTGVRGPGGIPALRDLPKAEHWYRRSLALRPEGDRQGRARSLAQLGAVAWEQAYEAKAAGDAQQVSTRVREALGHYHQALDLLPADAVNSLSVAHNQLGMIYKNIGQLDQALPHYQQAIRLFEGAGDHHHAAAARYNVAIALLQANRHTDALDYARAALQGFQRYGERAQRDIDDAQALIRHIQAAAPA
ncbi:tetratricopeptide repeat protein [uncultured Thiodictyon sp.]|uniref:tetratricopeptide repeat protein n=1 Tax=uncultured Thiodictyon sp. TaxID=1846217 RepID=UPI0025EE6EF3|nr:tetratricopeptide repeat protein [uncultured Thiodictyon sp.]